MQQATEVEPMADIISPSPLVSITITARLARHISRALMTASHPKNQQEFADIIKEQVPNSVPHVLWPNPGEPQVNWRAIGGEALR